MVELFNAALELMVAGMVIVYLFLGMLILAVNAMSAVLRRYFPEAPVVAAAQRAGAPAPGTDAGVTAAITAAVHRYRATHKS